MIKYSDIPKNVKKVLKLKALELLAEDEAERCIERTDMEELAISMAEDEIDKLAEIMSSDTIDCVDQDKISAANASLGMAHYKLEEARKEQEVAYIKHEKTSVIRRQAEKKLFEEAKVSEWDIYTHLISDMESFRHFIVDRVKKELEKKSTPIIGGNKNAIKKTKDITQIVEELAKN